MKINPFKYSSDNKRYHTLAYHNKSLGIKSQKAVIDAGLSCPNIDGKVSKGGCIFCDGSGGYFTNKNIGIKEQLDKEIERMKRLASMGGFIPCPDHRLMPGTKFELVQYYADEIKKIKV